MRVNLLELHLVGSDGRSCAVEDEESCARCSLVDGANEASFQLLVVLRRKTCLFIVSGDLPGGRQGRRLGHCEV